MQGGRGCGRCSRWVQWRVGVEASDARGGHESTEASGAWGGHGGARSNGPVDLAPSWVHPVIYIYILFIT
jgi:hypothetical protein